MNYKVIEYTCNHNFIYITDPDKRILKDHGSCPTCGVVIKKPTIDKPILDKFLDKLIKNQQDMPPEFSKAVDEHFYELF